MVCTPFFFMSTRKIDAREAKQNIIVPMFIFGSAFAVVNARCGLAI